MRLHRMFQVAAPLIVISATECALQIVFYQSNKVIDARSATTSGLAGVPGPFPAPLSALIKRPTPAVPAASPASPRQAAPPQSPCGIAPLFQSPPWHTHCIAPPPPPLLPPPPSPPYSGAGHAKRHGRPSGLLLVMGRPLPPPTTDLLSPVPPYMVPRPVPRPPPARTAAVIARDRYRRAISVSRRQPP